MSWHQLIRRLAILALIAGVLIFLIFKVQHIFAFPRLEVVSPVDGSMVYEKHLKIVGKSEPEVEIMINNKNFFVDSEGEFSADVDLQKGLNLIKITAKKRYSRIKEVDLRVLYK